MPDRYRFIFCVPLPIIVDGGKTMWRLSAERYGKNGGHMEVAARCIKGPDERILISDGREAPVVREIRMGLTCNRGTTLDKIVRKLVREGRAEIVHR